MARCPDILKAYQLWLNFTMGASTQESANQVERIAALEKALQDTIEYLRRLPAHPQTYHQVTKASDVLHARVMEKTAFSGAVYRPSGVLVLGAVLKGDVVTVHTQDVDGISPELVQSHTAGLYQALKAGVDIGLTHHSDRARTIKL